MCLSLLSMYVCILCPQVVELIRAGSGKDKKMLIVDQMTERDIRSQVSSQLATNHSVIKCIHLVCIRLKLTCALALRREG